MPDYSAPWHGVPRAEIPVDPAVNPDWCIAWHLASDTVALSAHLVASGSPSIEEAQLWARRRFYAIEALDPT